MLDRRSKRADEHCWTSQSANGGIATAHYLATEAGNAILTEGGNAVDAAVAASLALAVCEPAGSGIGGMAAMVVHLAREGRTFTIEGPCQAPQAARPKVVAASHRYLGYRAVAVPGYLAALDHALSLYGTRSLACVAARAIRLAEEGVPVTPLQEQLIEKHQETLRDYSAGGVFLDKQGRPRRAGSLLRQPVLARTLRRLVVAGLRDFYDGQTAREIADDMAANGGFVTELDLRRLVAREGMPLTAPFAGGVAHVLGPPGGGLSLGQLLYLYASMQQTVGSEVDVESPMGVLVTAHMISAVRTERRRMRLLVGVRDPGPAAQTLSKAWADELVLRLERSMRGGGGSLEAIRRRASGVASPPSQGGETSHLSVMDKEGNTVALTQSVERSFGSKEMCPELGFVYNGYLRAFKVQNRDHPYYLRPDTPARSNAAPTIVLKDRAPWIAVGSTGSERMASTIFTTLMRLQTATPFAAVSAPRLHATPDGGLVWEAGRFEPACRDVLEEHGFQILDLDDYAFETGGLQLVMREGRDFTAVADPRRDGSSAGPCKSISRRPAG